MFWHIPALSAYSHVESVLDKENFTLEELLDEEEIIQECKALNTRLINFLRDRAQVEQLLHYIVDEAPEDAEAKRVFKFPFIACEIFTCEIDVILKTLVEEEELMGLLFSFLEPNRPHRALLAGYFSKVVVFLMLRKTVPLMSYVQAHQDIFRQLVDLIGVTSIMEVLVRLVGADDHMYPNFMDVMQWLADSNLLEMIVDKLSPSSSPEVHANVAETLCAITRSAPSSLASKLSSPSFVARILGHALEDSQSKSGLICSLTVCIGLLDPKKLASSLIYSIRSQHFYEPPIPVNPETVNAMLPKLGDMLMLLNVSSDEKVLPTTFGELKPPLGRHRLKIVEFIAVLLRTGKEVAEEELVVSGSIKRILDLFFEYPFNNLLHHHVDSIIESCLESKSAAIVNHLIQDCNLIVKILQTDRHPILSSDTNQPTLPAAGRKAPRSGNLGHITRISNKIIQQGNGNSYIQAHLQGNAEWIDWQATVLHERNTIENVHRWVCGRPSAFQDRTRDSDEDDLHDKDYDVAALANNLSQPFRYSIYENEDAEEDVYFDDESAEVMISSLRLGDVQENLFTNSNWFAFQNDRIGAEPHSASSPEKINEPNLEETTNGGSSSSDDDEVVVGEDEELADSAVSISTPTFSNEDAHMNGEKLHPQDDKANASDNLSGDRPILNWVGWQESSDWNSFDTEPSSVMEPSGPTMNSCSNDETELRNGPTMAITPSLFEEEVGFIGVEVVGTERAMEESLKEGIVGESGPLKRNIDPKVAVIDMSDENGIGLLEFKDANYWRIDQEVAVVQQ